MHTRSESHQQKKRPGQQGPGRIAKILPFIILSAAVIFTALALYFRLRPNTFPTEPDTENDLARLSAESYESALLSMHSTESFKEEDFAYFRGLKTVVTSHSLRNTEELSQYLNCILSSKNTVSNLYFCLDPELLWDSVDQKADKWEKALSRNFYAYIKEYPQISFEVLLPYPCIDYWLQLKEKDFDTLLILYHNLVNELSVFPNVKIFFPGCEEWLTVNPDNYTNPPFDANEVITNKIFLYTFCDSNYQITPSNEDFFWNSLRQTVAREKSSPTHYPDLSDWCFVFFGDSVLGNFPGSFSIPGYVSGLSGALVYNYAVGGTSAASRFEGKDFSETFSSFIAENITASESGNTFTPHGIVIDDLKDRKLCFIFNYGFNDYFSGVPVKNPEDPYDETSFQGSLRTCISVLQTFLPDAHYIIMSPTHTMLFGNGLEITSPKGDVLSAYVEAGRELAEEMDLYFLDNYNHSAVTEETLETYLPDGTHPNEAGRLVLAKELMYFIEKELAGAQILP